jgi:hypothetical protein
MEKLDTILVIVLAIDAPDSPLIYNYNDSRLHDYDKGNYTVLDADSALEDIPEAANAVSSDSDSTSFLTDPFKTIKSWFTGIGSGVARGAKWVFTILGGPTSYLTAFGIPREIVFLIGSIWYAMTFILIVSWMLGR